jgi:hypothetical protein
MVAVEFQASVENGTIEIPSQYRNKLKKVVRVIVLAESEDGPENLIDQLLETPIRLEGFEPLSRDENYARPN